jgi:hypothetical protein
LELSEGEEIEFRKAAESLYRKTDFEYNRNGIWNLACPGATTLRHPDPETS